jgi:hypothetical protein
MPELTVAAGLARGLMEFAISRGADPAELATRSEMGPSDLADIDRRIPFEKYVSLMRAGKELAQDPALALHYGEANDMADVSVVGLIAYACETMAEAMVQVNRYGRLVVEFDGPQERFALVPRDGGEPEHISRTHRVHVRTHDLRAAPLRRDDAGESRACDASRARLSCRV